MGCCPVSARSVPEHTHSLPIQVHMPQGTISMLSTIFQEGPSYTLLPKLVIALASDKSDDLQIASAQ